MFISFVDIGMVFYVLETVLREVVPFRNNETSFYFQKFDKLSRSWPIKIFLLKPIHPLKATNYQVRDTINGHVVFFLLVLVWQPEKHIFFQRKLICFLPTSYWPVWFNRLIKFVFTFINYHNNQYQMEYLNYSKYGHLFPPKVNSSKQNIAIMKEINIYDQSLCIQSFKL